MVRIKYIINCVSLTQFPYKWLKEDILKNKNNKDIYEINFFFYICKKAI